MIDIIDKCPTCGSERKRRATNEKALILWSPNNNGLIIEHTKGGTLELQINKLNSFWVDDILGLEEYPKGRAHIWEGRIVVDEDNGDSHFHKGKFRNLNEDEWSRLKEGLPLFKKRVINGKQ